MQPLYSHGTPPYFTESRQTNQVAEIWSKERLSFSEVVKLMVGFEALKVLS